jgi:hypothetical protein
MDLGCLPTVSCRRLTNVVKYRRHLRGCSKAELREPSPPTPGPVGRSFLGAQILDPLVA